VYSGINIALNIIDIHMSEVVQVTRQFQPVVVNELF